MVYFITLLRFWLCKRTFLCYRKGRKEGAPLETITKIITAEEDGATVRHVLKAVLHFSTHAVARLTRAENGILVNGRHARTVDVLHTGDVLRVETGDHRPPKVLPTPGDWPLPIVWEDGHLLVVDKPAGMTAHASNFLPDTPTVAGALAWQRGTDFIFHSVNRLDKGTTGLMAVAKSGTQTLFTGSTGPFAWAVPSPCKAPSTPPSAGTRPPPWRERFGPTGRAPSPTTRFWCRGMPSPW